MDRERTPAEVQKELTEEEQKALIGNEDATEYFADKLTACRKELRACREMLRKVSVCLEDGILMLYAPNLSQDKLDFLIKEFGDTLAALIGKEGK